MERSTIDFGIDLGTTNSAISVLNGVTSEVIKNNVDADITPSAVYIGKQGQVIVGQRAKGRLETESGADDTFLEFKRRMGSDFRYTFKSSGLTKLPEELSAEVLKSLKGDVQQRLNEDVRAAVITIPAAFEQRQCAATRDAGKLAGFSQVALLQEPVAASLAYGFQRNVSSKAFWLVFDFGGGTFDAALMKAEDGDIQVVNHGGNNLLGGSDIDWAIMEQIIFPQLVQSYNLPDFKRGSQRWRVAFAKIKHAVEMAKIALSRSEAAFLEGSLLTDADGKEIDLERIQLKQGDVARVAEPLIDKAIATCRRVLSEKNLEPSALERVILVGGPTLAPYFRSMLKEKLGATIDSSVDPLTVVSKGAAIFAGTQRLDKSLRAQATAGQFNVVLNYEPIGSQEDPRVTGEVSSPDHAPLAGFTVEIVNPDTRWNSGKLTLNEEGKFTLRIRAEAGKQNVFEINLYSSTGEKQKIIPNHFTYTMGMTVKAQIVTNDLSLALSDNNRVLLVEKGTNYPFKKTNRATRASSAVRHGTDDKLRIPIIEGSEEKADWNPRLGELVITGRQISRDIPINTEIEITLSAKEPGALKVTAYIGILDEEYSCTIEYLKTGPTLASLEEELSLERKRMRAVGGDSPSQEELSNEIQKKMEDARDPDAAQQVQKDILKLREMIDEGEDASQWPKLLDEARDVLNQMDELTAKLGSADQKDQAKELHEAVQKAIEKKGVRGLQRQVQRVRDLNWEILSAQPAWWVGYLKYLYGKRDEMTDTVRAEQLYNQGLRSAAENSLDGIRRAVLGMLDLFPQEAKAGIQRGYGAGIQ